MHCLAGGLISVAAWDALKARKVMCDDDAVARLPARHSTADLHQLPCDFMPGVDAAVAGGRLTIPLHDVGTADAAGHHFGERLAGADLRHRTLLDADIAV